MSMAASGLSRIAAGQKGVALMPLVLTLVVAGALIAAGTNLVGPTSRNMRIETTRQLLDRAARSVIAWSATHGRLPTAAEFVAAAGVRDDPWRRTLVYVYDGHLAALSGGGLCGRETTTLTANGVTNTAFWILSAGENLSVDTAPAGSGAFSGAAVVSPLDLAQVVSLVDLRSRAGCLGRTPGRLVLLNSELPDGCSGQPYAGDLFIQGGVPPYTWTASGQPAWLTFSQVGAVWRGGGTPPVPGSHSLDVSVADAAGSSVNRRFDIAVDDCTAGP